jgi:hypothetical protein
MSGIATAIVGSAVVGGIVASNSASKAADAANNATNAAAAAGADQLAFQKQQYADQKPLIDKLGEQAVATNDQQQQIAKDAAARSATSWQQNQNATQAAVGQMGLNALGAQYLSPEDTAKAAAAQKVLSDPTASDADKAAAQSTINGLQKTAETTAIGLENAKGANIVNTATGQAGQVQAAGNATANVIGQNAQTIGGDLTAMGDARRADQTGFYNSQAQDLQNVARQRAADYEADENRRAEADIGSAAGDANRQLLLLGGDPNKMAAMSAQIANQQQLARIGAGNQIARTNIANLNAADDAARTLRTTGFNAGTQQQYGLQDAALNTKSAALEAARKTRADAVSAAQGIQFGAENKATDIENAAKDKADAAANARLEGTANYGAGFANTSGQNATTAVSAGTAGVNNLNTGAQGSVPMTNASNNAFGNVINSAKVQGDQSANILKAGSAEASNITGLGGVIGGLISSSKKVKKNRAPVDADAITEGLEHAQPQAYQYRNGKGPAGNKVGAMAEDMHKQFGDSVAPGGKVIDVQNMIGLQHAAIAGLSKRVKQLERKRA